MSLKVMSNKKVHAISNGIFLICLGLLIVTGMWWPGIILAIWATVFSRQYLSGRIYYAIVSSIVLLGLFVVSYFKFDFEYLAPILLVVGGIFIIVREYFFTQDTNGEEKSVEIIEDAEIDE
jgi:O-antigen ligase